MDKRLEYRWLGDRKIARTMVKMHGWIIEHRMSNQSIPRKCDAKSRRLVSWLASLVLADAPKASWRLGCRECFWNRQISDSNDDKDSMCICIMIRIVKFKEISSGIIRRDGSIGLA